MKLTYSLESVLQNDFGEMTVCFGLEFQKFLSDLEFTADTDYRGYEEYPEEAFHDTLYRDLHGNELAGITHRRQDGTATCEAKVVGSDEPLLVWLQPRQHISPSVSNRGAQINRKQS